MKPRVPDGVEVRVSHLRLTDAGYNTKKQAKEHGYTISTCGGMTVARLLDPATEEIRAVGIAICRADENYNKRLGRTIAIGRAIKELSMELTS